MRHDNSRRPLSLDDWYAAAQWGPGTSRAPSPSDPIGTIRQGQHWTLSGPRMDAPEGEVLLPSERALDHYGRPIDPNAHAPLAVAFADEPLAPPQRFRPWGDPRADVERAARFELPEESRSNWTPADQEDRRRSTRSVAQQSPHHENDLLFIAKDIAKSASTGALKGAIGTFGAPADVWKVIKDLVPSLEGVSPMMDSYAENYNTEKLVDFIEKRTGKFYDPQTTYGEYSSTITDFATGAAMPAGLARLGARGLGAIARNVPHHVDNAADVVRAAGRGAAPVLEKAVYDLGGRLEDGLRAIEHPSAREIGRQAASLVRNSLDALRVPRHGRYGNKVGVAVERTLRHIPNNRQIANQVRDGVPQISERFSSSIVRGGDAVAGGIQDIKNAGQTRITQDMSHMLREAAIGGGVGAVTETVGQTVRQKWGGGVPGSSDEKLSRGEVAALLSVLRGKGRWDALNAFKDGYNSGIDAPLLPTQAPQVDARNDQPMEGERPPLVIHLRKRRDEPPGSATE